MNSEAESSHFWNIHIQISKSFLERSDPFYGMRRTACAMLTLSSVGCEFNMYFTTQNAIVSFDTHIVGCSFNLSIASSSYWPIDLPFVASTGIFFLHLVQSYLINGWWFRSQNSLGKRSWTYKLILQSLNMYVYDSISVQAHVRLYSLVPSCRWILFQVVGCPIQCQMIGAHLSILACEDVDSFGDFETLYSTSNHPLFLKTLHNTEWLVFHDIYSWCLLLSDTFNINAITLFWNN